MADMERELDALKRAPARQHDPYGDPIEERGPQVSLFDELDRWYDSRVIQPQQQATEAYYRDVENVQGSEYFPVVQEDYEAHIASPAVARALSTGQTTHTNEFHKIVGRKFKDIAQNLKSAAAMIKEQQPKGTEPPHMESGQVPRERLPEGEDARRQELDRIQKESRGTDDDLDAIIKAHLPDGDPILDM
jgi:hypothetical protein